MSDVAEAGYWDDGSGAPRRAVRVFDGCTVFSRDHPFTPNTVESIARTAAGQVDAAIIQDGIPSVASFIYVARSRMHLRNRSGLLTRCAIDGHVQVVASIDPEFLKPLTADDQLVMRLIALGCEYDEIAGTLGVNKVGMARDICRKIGLPTNCCLLGSVALMGGFIEDVPTPKPGPATFERIEAYVPFGHGDSMPVEFVKGCAGT